ncbi:MAG: hypothetical protein RML94_15525 [Bacteroidia bacterium]|nr:hypothetical protein [Bacteroidia bacterium]
MRHAEGASAVRSAAKHRSDSAARSTPTRALAKGHAPNIFKDTHAKN